MPRQQRLWQHDGCYIGKDTSCGSWVFFYILFASMETKLFNNNYIDRLHTCCNGWAISSENDASLQVPPHQDNTA